MTNSKMLLTINEAVTISGIGRTSLYQLFKSGDLQPVKVGKRTLIRREDLESFVKELVPREAAA